MKQNTCYLNTPIANVLNVRLFYTNGLSYTNLYVEHLA